MKKVRDKGGEQALYQLTRDGLRLLNDFGIQTRGYRGVEGLYRSAKEHDGIMRKLRDIFLQSPIVSNYLTEAKVKSTLAKKHGGQKSREEFYKVPDAIFTLRQSHKALRIAVELEIALKSKKRYLMMMQQLCLSNDFDNVFLIAQSENVLNQLRSHLRDVRENNLRVRHHDHEHGFYFVLLSKFLEDGLEARFEGDDGAFTLRSLEPKSLLSQPRSNAFLEGAES